MPDPIAEAVRKAADQLRRLGHAIVAHDIADEVQKRLNESGIFPNHWVIQQKGLYETWLLLHERWQ